MPKHFKDNKSEKSILLVVVYLYVGDPYRHFTDFLLEYTKVTQDYEVLTVTITKPNFRKLLVLCIYKPPTGTVENCIGFFTDIISNPHFAKREIWILGDFNVDILKRDDPNVTLLQGFVKKKKGWIIPKR